MENLKVKVSTAQESKEAQELFFKLGYKWSGDSKVMLDFDMPEYIINWNNGYITVGDDFDKNRQEITIAELRAMVASQNSSDEPFITPECSLNDQYAEIEQVRQHKKHERNSSAWNVQVGGDHYKSMKIQPAQFALENKLDYCQANAIKYICRHQSKNGKQDLEKAKHYIDLLIEHYYGGEI